ncbi:hypothetical protein AMS68_000746 [Peltaster fructicola]|uniref:SGNH hydrolase-type esterase domain-containing protein n=1 Tax=Peltaster fructicola TaxID=286661 RepID=A0A6H0XKS1_9PEZI|nr:hypothetical protein AMS68_000746 [Peltaster fructicola]
MSARIVLFALAVSLTSALVVPSKANEKRSSYPFNQIVAFGDELSDNGNGSYAHGITGNPANVYSFGTWTDGPVAVSYLADMLGVPLVDYAFGGCCGGGTFGAVLDNTYTSGAAQVNGAPVPSLHDQIRSNYTQQPNNNIKNSLQFIWIGENDVSMHTDAFWQGDPKNADFAKQYSSRVTAEAEYLVSQGAPYVFVANIYPKHLAPVTKTYLCPDGSCVSTWGAIIQQANDALEQSLAASPSASKFIYYDANAYITALLNTKDYWGLSAPANVFCDGGEGNEWDTCISGSYVWQGATKFFWMNYIQPTTTVHHMIAVNMKERINEFFAGHY